MSNLAVVWSQSRTNVQQLTCKMVWFFSFQKGPNFKESPGGKLLKKCEEVRQSVAKYRNDVAL